MENPIKLKTHLKDIKEGKQLREEKTFVINGKAYWADRTNKDMHATHDDCENCGKEFEKRYTLDRKCLSCNLQKVSEDYKSLELKSWDGKTPLVLYKDDRYFFDVDDLVSYCEDNEFAPEELSLCLCKQSSFTTLDFETWIDDVHEDYEFSVEFEHKLKDFNDFLEKEKTNTWFQDNYRVIVTSEDLGITLQQKK